MKKKIIVIKSIVLLFALALAAGMLASCGHEHNVVMDDAVPATCTAPGLTVGAHCADCGEVFAEQQVIEAAGHKIITTAAVEPTCTAPGLSTGAYCGVCGEIIKEQTPIAPLGHYPVNDDAVSATCTTGGRTSGSHCADCGAVIVKQEDIPVCGHTLVTEPAVEATALKVGYTKRVFCSTCGEVFVERETVSYKSGQQSGTSSVEQTDVTDPAENAVLTLGAVSALMTREYSDAEITSMKSLDLAIVRKRINTMGDAIAFLDAFNTMFWSGGDLTYNPANTLSKLKSGHSDASTYSFLVGYLLSDNILELQVIQSACYDQGSWFYSGLLIPYQTSWLIISPGMFSAAFKKCNNAPCFFDMKIIPSLQSADDFTAALHTVGVDDDGMLNNIYLFTPLEKEYVFQNDGASITCDDLVPISAAAPQKDYDEMISRLIAVEMSDDKIEQSILSTNELQAVLALCDTDINIASANTHTLSSALALLIFRGYRASGYDTQIDDGNLIWHYHYNAEKIYNRNWGDCGSSSTLMGYLLRDDYDEVGVISMTYAKGQGGGHVINYVKSGNTYYVFDVVSLVANGYSGQGFNFSTGDSLEKAYLNYRNKTSSNEIFAFSWKATDRDIPVGWYTSESKWGTIVLPTQYKDQITILYQAGSAKYEYKPISANVYNQIEGDR